MNKLYQCSFCENCYRSNEERKKHEEVCDNNRKIPHERFKAKVRQLNEKKNNPQILGGEKTKL